MKLRKVLGLIGFILFSLGSFAQKEKSTKAMDLYLLIGQSNMAGRGVIDAESEQTSKAILMLDKSNNWVIAKDPLHFDKAIAGVGPGLSFAKTMLKGQKKKKKKLD